MTFVKAPLDSASRRTAAISGPLKKAGLLPIRDNNTTWNFSMPAVLDKTSAMRPMGVGKAYQPELLALMAKVDLLANLTGHEPDVLSHYLEAFEVDKGCVIFREGEPGHYMCLLVSGQIKTYKESDSEHKAEVANESRGRSVGEMALIDGEPRSATCIATEPSVLLLLSKASFQRLCEQRPALALKLLSRIAKLLSRRLRLTSGRLVDYLGG